MARTQAIVCVQADAREHRLTHAARTASLPISPRFWSDVRAGPALVCACRDGCGENEPYWCGCLPCTHELEAPLSAAWALLAARYCHAPNVIMADLFNEPYLASWGTGEPRTDWDLAVSRIGSALLDSCPRWLLVAQGVANNGGLCAAASGYHCWWGENLIGQLHHPIELPNHPGRLVLSPHVYGHNPNMGYMNDPSFPSICPAVWSAHWASIPEATGTPLLVGEFGGVCNDTVWHQQSIPATAAWQAALVAFLRDRNIGWFYWTRAHRRPP